MTVWFLVSTACKKRCGLRSAGWCVAMLRPNRGLELLVLWILWPLQGVLQWSPCSFQGLVSPYPDQIALIVILVGSLA